MKERTLKTKLLTVLLTLCLALSFVPITAYAGVTDVTGDNTTNAYTHTYHTKVTTTAQVIIKDASGNVVETTEISKSGDFIEGNLSDDAVQAEIKRIDDEIKTQYSSRGSITIENCNSAMVFDHFESSNIFTPDDDIPVGDQDALENATSGSVNRHLDVYEYQVYQTTYDLIVQENNAAFKEITTVEIIGATLSYKPGETPRATAAVAAADQGKYRITYECWQELNENDVPVAVWYSDDGIYTTLPTITAFESGKKYVYSVLLMPEEYDFGRKVAATVNGNAVTAVPAVDGYLSLPNVKTMIPTADSHTHSYGTAWKYDETNHWHECASGDTGDTAAHTFKWVTDKEATATEKGSKHEECSVCGYKKAAVEIPTTGSATQPTNPNKPTGNKTGETTSPKTGGNSNMLLWVALLFISGGVLTVFGIASGKKSKNALK